MRYTETNLLAVLHNLRADVVDCLVVQTPLQGAGVDNVRADANLIAKVVPNEHLYLVVGVGSKVGDQIDGSVVRLNCVPILVPAGQHHSIVYNIAGLVIRWLEVIEGDADRAGILAGDDHIRQRLTEFTLYGLGHRKLFLPVARDHLEDVGGVRPQSCYLCAKLVLTKVEVGRVHQFKGDTVGEVRTVR